MSCSKFGQDLAPGCTNADIEQAAGGDVFPWCENCLDGEDCDRECERSKKLRKESEQEEE